MKWVKAVYRFAGFFSYRVPDFSSQFALTSPIPGPSTVKLGLISTGIERKGDPSYGEVLFNLLKTAKIRILPPERLSICNFLQKRLKKWTPKTKEQKEIAHEHPPLTKTFGTRGYVHYGGPLTIYVGVEDGAEEIRKVAERMYYLGTSDSVMSCVESGLEEPPDQALRFQQRLQEMKAGEWLVMLKDINPEDEICFAHLNPFVKKPDNKKPLIPCYTALPLKARREGGNWTVYELGG